MLVLMFGDLQVLVLVLRCSSGFSGENTANPKPQKGRRKIGLGAVRRRDIIGALC